MRTHYLKIYMSEPLRSSEREAHFFKKEITGITYTKNSPQDSGFFFVFTQN